MVYGRPQMKRVKTMFFKLLQTILFKHHFLSFSAELILPIGIASRGSRRLQTIPVQPSHSAQRTDGHYRCGSRCPAKPFR